MLYLLIDESDATIVDLALLGIRCVVHLVHRAARVSKEGSHMKLDMEDHTAQYTGGTHAM
jgi:hypothetical protein